MLEYVYIKNKRNPLKVTCCQAQGNLPDFTKTSFTADSYEKDMKEAEKWEAYFYNETRYEDAYRNLFTQNFELFCTHHKEILSRPEFANIRWVYPFWWCQYRAFNGTLGEAISLWLTNPSYDGNTTLNHATVVKMKEAYKSDKSVKPVHIVELLTYLRIFNESEAKELLDYYSNPPSKPTVVPSDIYVPLKAWTESFVLAALKAGLPFGYLPARFKTQEIRDKASKL